MVRPRPRRRERFPEAASVIAHDPARRRERVPLGIPHPAIGDSRVDEHDRVAAAGDLVRQAALCPPDPGCLEHPESMHGGRRKALSFGGRTRCRPGTRTCRNSCPAVPPSVRCAPMVAPRGERSSRPRRTTAETTRRPAMTISMPGGGHMRHRSLGLTVFAGLAILVTACGGGATPSPSAPARVRAAALRLSRPRPGRSPRPRRPSRSCR